MTVRRAPASSAARVVVLAVAGTLVVHGLQLAALLAARATLDRHAYVSDLRLDAALETFRPVERSGLASPVDPTTFRPDRNPQTHPGVCAPLTVLASRPPVDGRSWTGINGQPAQPVTLLTVRFADAGGARTELDRKRLAMLRCSRVEITFPPYGSPPTAYAVEGRHWASSLLGTTLRWSLDGGGRHFDFYVRRYGNTLTWTYADDVSTPQVRQEVADSLVARLHELAR